MNEEQLQHIKTLSKQYPNIRAVTSEIINLNAILNLPKGTEHFMSDIHGEHEAFTHIVNNASGVIKEKVDILYDGVISKAEREKLTTLIYYPKEKMEELEHDENIDEWYVITVNRLIEVSRLICSKYTRSKVRKSLPKEYAYIIEELLTTDETENNKIYRENIIKTIIEVGATEDFIFHICNLIKRMSVDRLHIVGDIFDRGARADIVLNRLIEHHSVDVQWGNHDALWIGAGMGSRACIANVLRNSIKYNNIEVIEVGYGISLRRLAMFAEEVYSDSDLECYRIDSNKKIKNSKSLALMNKAITILIFKLDAEIIKRNKEFEMEDRLLLDKINYDEKTIVIDGKKYEITDIDFPTIDRDNPYQLTDDEFELMEELKKSFTRSQKLQEHIKFLFSNGGVYKCFNGNLLIHGCVPMDKNGEFKKFVFDGNELMGKKLLDYIEINIREGYIAKSRTGERQWAKDLLWFLWCGKDSPLFARKKIALFERVLIKDKNVWQELENEYYSFADDEKMCRKILAEFGLLEDNCIIVNGHVPVKAINGETPVKANGKRVVIDGGFCKAYQGATGIAGYTLIYNSWGVRISSHESFVGIEDAIKNNKDIISTTFLLNKSEKRVLIKETDVGEKLQKEMLYLSELLKAYNSGAIKEK